MYGFASRFFARVFRPAKNYRGISAQAIQASFPASSLAVIPMVAYLGTVTRRLDKTEVPEDGGKSHHITRNGKTIKFQNIFPSMGEEVPVLLLLTRVFRTLLGPHPETKNLVDLHVVPPEFLPSRTGTGADKLRATWLGHACYYVEFPSGLRVLFDPVFEHRCSPVTWLGPQRYTKAPCSLAELPFVDAVVISHSHYDHLSHDSVLSIQKHQPKAHFFVPLGLEKWFRDSGIAQVTELDWWQDAELKLERENLGKRSAAAASDPEADDKAPESILAQFTCLPAQHVSGRSHFDRNKTLWASWSVASGGKSVWFGGDTGYRAVPYLPAGVDDYGPDFADLPRNPHFKQIGDLKGPFDLGLIPIGAYSPRGLWSPVHANPYDAVEIFRDTRCTRAMGIHWGTWVLTPEEVEEPPLLLKQALQRAGIPEAGVFDVCDVGESREF